MGSGHFLDESIRIIGLDCGDWLPPSTELAGRNTFAMNNIETRTPPATAKYPNRGT